jgi:hypothetical protein
VILIVTYIKIPNNFFLEFYLYLGIYCIELISFYSLAVRVNKKDKIEIIN